MIPFPVKGLGLILDEFKAHQQSKMKSTKVDPSFLVPQFYKNQQDESEDEEEYETDSQGEDPYSFYNEDYADSDDEEDSESKNDPLYLLDLVGAVKSWVYGLNQNRSRDLSDMAGFLSPEHREMVSELVTQS